MDNMPDNVVVFGATGFIGRNFVSHIQGRVRRLIGVSRHGSIVPGVEAVAVTDLGRLRLDGETIVVHLAGFRSEDVDRIQQAQSAILLNNTHILEEVYQFCIRNDVREVRMASGTAVYNGALEFLDDEQPLDLMRDPGDSELMYGWSKRIGEIFAKLYHQKYGVNTISFRLQNTYGPLDDLEERRARVVPALIIRALRTEGPFTVRGTQDAMRDFIFVEDVCNVFEKSLRMRGHHSVYNLGTGTNTTIGDLARSILRLTGTQRELASQGQATSTVMHRRCRVDRLKQDFDMKAFVALEEGLRRTILWYSNALSKA